MSKTLKYTTSLDGCKTTDTYTITNVSNYYLNSVTEILTIYGTCRGYDYEIAKCRNVISAEFVS